MRLRSIEVRGLFGEFDHIIPLNVDDRVTILYGPNGYGKTTVLRMVASILKGQLELLRNTVFESVVLEFTNDDVLTIAKPIQRLLSSEDPLDIDEPKLTITLSIAGQPSEQIPDRHIGTADLGFPLGQLEHDLPITRVASKHWRDDRTGDLLALSDVIEQFSSYPPLAKAFPPDERLSSFLSSMSVHLIETHRLLPPGLSPRPLPVDVSPRWHQSRKVEEETVPAVERYSRDLVTLLRSALGEWAQTSQRLDRTFVGRVLKSQQVDLTEEIIRTRYEQQMQRWSKLMDAGILDSEEDLPLPSEQMDDGETRVLGVYLDDLEAKLSVFDPLLRKIELFTQVINSRFQFKQLEINSDEGFIFRSNNGPPIAPIDLSSGEQHEIVLTYELVFKVPDGSLVLIDEPEISLHVSWQQKFLEDIARVSEAANLDFLIATHSPQIIHDHWDLCVQLGKPS